MYRLLNSREQKAYMVSMVVNSILATGVLYAFVKPTQTISFLLLWFVGTLAFQLLALMLPNFILNYVFKPLSPFEERRNLKNKMQCLQEQMKQINRKEFKRKCLR